MIVECPACQSRYRFDEAKLGGRPKVTTRCAKCGGSIHIENPAAAGASSADPAPTPSAGTPAPSMDEEKTSTKRTAVLKSGSKGGSKGDATGHDLEKLGVLELPKDRRFSLAVIQGPGTGTALPITKVRTTIGRSGCDLNLEDSEASRQHAAVEIFGDHAVLRDLGSTNGTFVESEKIENHVLENLSEFRIGSHVVMFISTLLE